MSYTLEQRMARVLNRRNPYVAKSASVGAGVVTMDSAVESIVARNYSDYRDSAAVQMILAAMSPIDKNCVAKSLEAGEKVKNHLTAAFLGRGEQVPEFDYQGSVVANTQIKGASDIDLLVISDKSFMYDRKGISTAYSNSLVAVPQPWYTGRLKDMLDWQSYKGNSLSDIRQQRGICEACLATIYNECDLKKGKAVQILNKTLNQKVDVVNCIWFDNVQSVICDRKKPYRGIKIYDKKADDWTCEDYPFLKIEAINRRDEETSGNFKKLIRLFKTFKEDAEVCTHLSSFDIYSLVYQMPTATYANKSEIDAVMRFQQFLGEIATHAIDPLSIKRLGCDEFVFRDDKDKFNDFLTIYKDFLSICEGLKKRPQIVYG